MKGVVFNIVEDVVTAAHGPDTWDALLDDADLGGSYTALGSYPDEELTRLVGASSAALDTPPDEVVRWLGHQALGEFLTRYPHFFTPHRSVRPFLLTLNDVIHPEVRKLYPGADVPTFDFDASQPGTLVIGYRSHRQMCAFAVGLIEGAGEHYGERVVIDQPACMHRGDNRCLLHCTLTPLAKTA